MQCIYDPILALSGNDLNLWFLGQTQFQIKKSFSFLLANNNVFAKQNYTACNGFSLFFLVACCGERWETMTLKIKGVKKAHIFNCCGTQSHEKWIECRGKSYLIAYGIYSLRLQECFYATQIWTECCNFWRKKNHI